jgi:hypothetical protein
MPVLAPGRVSARSRTLSIRKVAHSFRPKATVLCANLPFCYKRVSALVGYGRTKRGLGMDRIENFFDVAMRYVFEPGLNWVLQHPIVSVVVVVALVYWSVRGYRMM